MSNKEGNSILLACYCGGCGVPLTLMHHTPHPSPLTPFTLLQVGPELEVPGYGCEDHFFELDTVVHSWEALAVGDGE